eukprot:5599782-Lingulodinium_polyedra.AAC.1
MGAALRIQELEAVIHEKNLLLLQGQKSLELLGVERDRQVSARDKAVHDLETLLGGGKRKGRA